MYDMDVPAINEKLLSCKVNFLLSNPCFELWLLLHSKDQKVCIDTDSVIKELKKIALWGNYTKSTFSDTQQAFLKKNMDVAIGRSKNLVEFQNPSTCVYKLIEILKDSISN